MMKVFFLLVILFQINAGISFAQTPVQLDKASAYTGVTSPLPEEAASKQIQQGINYYPDTRLPEFTTRTLLLTGLITIIFGTALLTSHAWLALFQFKRKSESPVLLKQFGHHL